MTTVCKLLCWMCVPYNRLVVLIIWIDGGLWRQRTLLAWPGLRPALLHVTVVREATFNTPQCAASFARSMSKQYCPTFLSFRLRAPVADDGFIFHVDDSEGKEFLKSLRSLALLHLAAAEGLSGVWTGNDYHMSYY